MRHFGAQAFVFATRILLLCGVCPTIVHAAADPPAATPETPSAVEQLRQEALRLAPLVRSDLGKSLLAAVPDLPAISGKRLVYFDRQNRDALNEEEAAARGDLDGYERLELDETFYYTTRYGTPLASVRAFDLVGQAGLSSVAGKKICDFGFGSIGQLRLLASLGAEVTGIEVDALLQRLYAAPGDTGDISPSRAAPSGAQGSVRLLFGHFPVDPSMVEAAGTGYGLFISKNTLKRGYIHPAREVEPRFLVHLGVDDASFLRAVYRMLAPGGFMMIYNLSPAPSKPDESYKPWSDGHSPFHRALFEEIGFRVLAFDVDDTETARQWGRTFGWDSDMDLDTDLFGTYTLVQRPSAP